ncbi:SCO family protein [Porticoccaceae bacterium]|jgi:protein SCO1/2|nr:SCO family protein [Porticoccaceae bacterium]|tara:strand:+ start:293 stop:922 length:630 start_codon:yes stop_codon:yes gene_type:complete
MSILVRALSRGFFVGALLAGQVMLAAEAVAATDDYERLKNPVAVKPFFLVDHNGVRFNLQSLKNHWSMIFIGFTTCPDVCPVTLGNLEAVRAEMGLRVSPERIPRIIFLAVDPARDVPVLKEYLGYFHPQYIGISGEVNQIGSLINSLNAFYRLDKKHTDDNDYDVLHTAYVSLINPAGEMVAKLNPPFHPHKTAMYLSQLISGVRFDD